MNLLSIDQLPNGLEVGVNEEVCSSPSYLVAEASLVDGLKDG